MTTINEKIHKAAKNYIHAKVRWIAWDSHEDIDEMEHSKYTYDLLIEGTEFATMPVRQFIKTYYPMEYKIAIEQAESDVGPIDEDYMEWIEDEFGK
jgi:hypothetical protein